MNLHPDALAISTGRPPQRSASRSGMRTAVHVWPRCGAHVAKTPRPRSEGETQEPPRLLGFSEWS